MFYRPQRKRKKPECGIYKWGMGKRGIGIGIKIHSNKSETTGIDKEVCRTTGGKMVSFLQHSVWIQMEIGHVITKQTHQST